MTSMFVREDWMLFRTLQTLGQKKGAPATVEPKPATPPIATAAHLKLGAPLLYAYVLYDYAA